MSVTATTSATTASDIQANPAGYVAKRTLKQTLGSDDFMKLLSTQMATQDPLKPMEDTAFISQMASFSSLNQMNQLTKDFAILKANQAVTGAASFIGRTATVTDPKDSTKYVTGVITGVDTSGSEPLIEIDGGSYPLSSVQRIEAGTTSTSATTSSSSPSS